MESRVRASPEQLSTLLEYMETHGDLARPLAGSQGRVRSDRLWADLTNTLNAVGGGVKKTTEKWKKRSQSSAQDDDPVAQRSQSSAQDNDPVAQRSQSSAQDNDPVAHRSQSSAQDNDPVAQRSQSSTQDDDPVTEDDTVYLVTLDGMVVGFYSEFVMNM